MTYRFTDEASKDLDDAADFYESRRTGLGIEFADEVDAGISHILEAPTRWPEVERDVRKYRTQRFPYGILYRIANAREIDIVAIFDLRRRPGAWRSRSR